MKWRIAIECAIVLTVLGAAANWGTWYWNQSLAIGRHPFFYQLYYEPAVMVACGEGFVVAQPQIPEMTRFLNEQTQTFDCKAIPKNAKLGTDGLYQGSSRYVMTAIAWTWRLVGVSWRKLGPFAGLLFALTVAAAYGIFRLGMGRVMAVLCAWALSVSTLHVANLPSIRDYAKAPFTLLVIFLIGLLVTIRPSWPRVLGISIAAGVVVGIGYGFRSDLLITIPPFVLAAMLFLDARWPDRLKFGAAASAMFLATFYVSAWPVITSVRDTWGCQWHTAIIGLGDDATNDLGLEPTAYDWLDGYTDDFVYATTTSHAARARPGVKHIEYCGQAYDEATRTFMLDVARRTPADFIVRAYASALQMVQLPLRWRNPPMPHVAVDYYKIRKAITSHAQDAGLFLVIAAVVLIAASSIRLGLFVIGLLVYFGGYPAVQFANRHYFHLEFITWWAFGFLVQQIAAQIVARVRRRPARTLTVEALKRSVLVVGASFATLLAALWIARWYQESALEPLMQRYASASLDEVVTSKGPGNVQLVSPVTTTRTDPETADLLAIDLDASKCPEGSRLAFVYDRSHLGFARDMAIEHTASSRPTRVFLPVFATFRGVTVGDAPPGCLKGVYRVRHPEAFPLMPKVVLRPGWEGQPLYQSLKGWGIEPPPDE